MSLRYKIKGMVFPVFKRILSFVSSNRRLKYFNFRMSIFLANHGIIPLFSPSAASTVRRWLEQGTKDSAVDPKTYLKEDNSICELFKEVLPYLSKESAMLEIGCNVGRSLNYLHRHGYRNLTGIEIGCEAVELMKASFPEMYRDSRIIIGDVTEEIKKLSTNGYDLVFCHSVLVSISPRCNHIFKEMARVSNKFILTLENEGSYTVYPRNFKKMFEKQGYKMIVSKIFTAACHSLPVPFETKHIYENNTIRLFVKDITSF